MILATSILAPALAASVLSEKEEKKSQYPRDLEVGDKVTVTDWCHITERTGKVTKITPKYIYVEIQTKPFKVMKFNRFNQICGNFQIDDLFFDIHEKF